MSQEEKSYTREFKAQVVLETVSGDDINPVEVAEKHGIDPSLILKWARRMDISDEKLDRLKEKLGADDEHEIVELETLDPLFVEEIEFGASFDALNMKSINYWVLYGSAFVTLVFIGLLGIFYFNSVSTTRQVSEKSDFYRITQQELSEQERLSSFGVVDLEEGIYRMPVDSVISRMAVD